MHPEDPLPGIHVRTTRIKVVTANGEEFEILPPADPRSSKPEKGRPMANWLTRIKHRIEARKCTKAAAKWLAIAVENHQELMAMEKVRAHHSNLIHESVLKMLDREIDAHRTMLASSISMYAESMNDADKACRMAEN